MSIADPKTIGLLPETRVASRQSWADRRLAVLERGGGSPGGGGASPVTSVADTTNIDLNVTSGQLTADIKTTAIPQVARLGIGKAVHGTACLSMDSGSLTNLVVDDTADGDPQYYFGEVADGQRWEIQHGSSGAPVVTPGPTFKVSRCEEQDGGAYAGSGTSPVGFSAIQAINYGLPNTTAQPTAIVGVVSSAGTTTPGFPDPNTDANAIMAFGHAADGCTGRGIGTFARGSIGSAAAAGAGATGAEAQCHNSLGAKTWAAGGAIGKGSGSMGFWVPSAGGPSQFQNGAAIQIGKTQSNSPQWDVGIGITGAGAGQGNAIATASFIDDGNAPTSIYIGSTHSTAALAIGAGSGKVLIGMLTTALATRVLVKPNADTDRALTLQPNSATQSVALLTILNNAGAATHEIFNSGGVVNTATSATAHQFSGTNTNAITVSSTSGKVLVGLTTTSIATKTLIKSTADADAALCVQSNSTSASVPIFQVLNGSGTAMLSAYENGNLIIGGAFQITDRNIFLGTTTGTKFGTATNQKLAFYNSTPIVQPSGIGAAATDAATTQTLANNLRTALINLGLVAA